MSADTGGHVVPPVYADGVRDAFGVDLADIDVDAPVDYWPAEPGESTPDPSLVPWLEDGAELTSFLIGVEIDGREIRGAFVHVDNLPFLGSDSPTALRALATHCAELADRLEAIVYPGAGATP